MGMHDSMRRERVLGKTPANRLPIRIHLRAFMSTALLWFRRTCWLGVVIWVVTVFILSSLSGEEVAGLNAFDVSDKTLHFAAFFCGALPLVPGLRLTWGWSWTRVIFTAIGAVSLYGALDEVHQIWTPSRSGLDVYDWIADTLGALAGAPFAAFIHAFAERKYRTSPPGT
jgi:VanZ family protein